MDDDNYKLVGYKGKSRKVSGIVYMPYRSYMCDSGKQYKSFMKEYALRHAACPVCGSTACSSTYVGYVFNGSDPDSYKDENTCVCCECGDSHITHARVRANNE